MSLACLVCHVGDSPSHSFRSYSVSSSDNEGRCSAIANCLMIIPSNRTTPNSNITSSKVMPYPNNIPGGGGFPRLERSHAVRRDIVRDWNLEELMLEH